MHLKYHQATYDLLTQEFIDPQKAVEDRDEAERIRRKMITPDEGPEVYEKKLAQAREKILSWTKLKLFQHPPTVSQQNVEALTQIEEKYSIALPASVREWYSLDIALEMMMAQGFGSKPIAEFAPISASKWIASPREDLWYFLWDEFIDQGGEPIVFQLGSDNPVVLARYQDTYLEVAPTFSDFIYLYFWDWYRQYTSPYAISISGLIPEQYQIELEVLRRTYHELPGNIALRFYNDEIVLKVFRDWETDFPPAIWTKFKGGVLSSNSLPALRQAILNLWGHQIPFRWMTSYGTRFSHTDEMKQMLANLKSEVATE